MEQLTKYEARMRRNQQMDQSWAVEEAVAEDFDSRKGQFVVAILRGRKLGVIEHYVDVAGQSAPHKN